MKGTRRARPGSVVLVIGSTLGLLLASAPAGMAADNGTVSADVTVAQAAACLELSAESVSFGTLALGVENAEAAPGIQVENCGDADATIYASGSDAAGGGASWNLVDSGATCANTLGLDSYHLGLATPAGASIASLSTENKELGVLGGAATVDHVARISTACPGSSGAGELMSMQISYLATNIVVPPIVLEELNADQATAEAVAAFIAPASRDYDTPANCGGSPSIACPGGVPSDPLPKVRVQAANVNATQVDSTLRWTMTSALTVTTPTGIPVTYSGVSCTANVNSANGASPTFGGAGDLNFLSYPDPAGPTNYVGVTNANITGVETADVSLTGGSACALLSAFASVFVPMLEDQIETYLEGNICGAPEPAVFMACPPLT